MKCIFINSILFLRVRQQVGTVNHQRRTCDILVHREVQDCLCVVPGHTSSSERNTPFLLEVLLLVALVGFDRGHFTGAAESQLLIFSHVECMHLQITGGESVDPDFQVLQVDCKLLGQADGAGLGGVV